MNVFLPPLSHSYLMQHVVLVPTESGIQNKEALTVKAMEAMTVGT